MYRSIPIHRHGGDDLNFYRFLTSSLFMGLEDPSITPLFRPLTARQLHGHFASYNAHRFPVLAAKKMHLYVHVPFCATICSFCHCWHQELKGHQQLSTYVDFILKQIEEFSPLFDQTYFGRFTILGGTASLLSPSDIKKIFEAVVGKFRFSPQAGFNFEGHPSSLSTDRLNILKSQGVEKIHLGIQSLDSEVLKKINRYQTSEGVERCIKNIKERGFACLNVDMVAGLPGQTTDGFLDDLKTLVDWGVDLFNINPFSDITCAACSKENSSSLQEVLSRRHEMIVEAKKLLESYGYGNKAGRGYLKGAAAQNTSFEPELFPGGVLGLGVLARSNLPGELVFETRPLGNDYDVGHYFGYPVDKRYSMAQYVLLHLLYGLQTKAFHKVYGEEFGVVFEKEIQWLQEQQVISKNNGTYAYNRTINLKGLFDYFVHTKILLGDKILTQLRELYMPRYDPAVQYGAREDLLNVLQNFDYARDFYQVGKKTLWL